MPILVSPCSAEPAGCPRRAPACSRGVSTPRRGPPSSTRPTALGSAPSRPASVAARPRRSIRPHVPRRAGARQRPVQLGVRASAAPRASSVPRRSRLSAREDRRVEADRGAVLLQAEDVADRRPQRRAAASARASEQARAAEHGRRRRAKSRKPNTRRCSSCHTSCLSSTNAGHAPRNSSAFSEHSLDADAVEAGRREPRRTRSWLRQAGRETLRRMRPWLRLKLARLAPAPALVPASVRHADDPQRREQPRVAEQPDDARPPGDGDRIHGVTGSSSRRRPRGPVPVSVGRRVGDKEKEDRALVLDPCVAIRASGIREVRLRTRSRRARRKPRRARSCSARMPLARPSHLAR